MGSSSTRLQAENPACNIRSQVLATASVVIFKRRNNLAPNTCERISAATACTVRFAQNLLGSTKQDKGCSMQQYVAAAIRPWSEPRAHTDDSRYCSCYQPLGDPSTIAKARDAVLASAGGRRS